MINRYSIFLISFLITISCNNNESKKKSKKNKINTSISEFKNLKNDDRKVKVESFFLKSLKKINLMEIFYLQKMEILFQKKAMDTLIFQKKKS